MVLTLDSYFTHAAPHHGGQGRESAQRGQGALHVAAGQRRRLVQDKTIRLDPAKSVLGYAVGDEIKVGEEGFTRLAEAFFAEIEAKYV